MNAIATVTHTQAKIAVRHLRLKATGVLKWGLLGCTPASIGKMVGRK